jgi:hypothetical protein
MKSFNRGPSFGMIGLVFSGFFFIAFLLAAIDEGGLVLWLLVLLTLPIVTLTEQVSLDFDKYKYVHGHLILGIIQTGKWKHIDERCYLKIEPTAVTREVNYGMVNLGHATSRKSTLWFIDRSLREKWILSEGKYSVVSNQAQQLFDVYNMEIKDFIRRSNSRGINAKVNTKN